MTGSVLRLKAGIRLRSHFKNNAVVIRSTAIRCAVEVAYAVQHEANDRSSSIPAVECPKNLLLISGVADFALTSGTDLVKLPRSVILRRIRFR
jgi:hypothetical protein